MKSLPNITAACLGLAAGALLVLASREGQTQASYDPPAIIAPEQATVIAPVTPLESEQPAPPQPVPSVDAYTVVASASASGDCANGVCAPRAATVHRYQPQTRRGLFGGRFRR
jgi:hypothetical protein